MNYNNLKPDPVLKDYWRNNDRFADLFNQVLFHGKPIISSSKLTDRDTEESTIYMDKDLKGTDEFLSGITKEDKIKPVITIVLYYGEKPWDGPLQLSDMMDIPPIFQSFFNEQKISSFS